MFIKVKFLFTGSGFECFFIIYETIVCHSKAIGIQEGKLSIGKFDIDVYHTPGHTCGSCCFRIEDHLFSGDTLFQGSIGRMDLPTGSVMQMKESLRKLSALEDDYRYIRDTAQLQLSVLKNSGTTK